MALQEQPSIARTLQEATPPFSGCDLDYQCLGCHSLRRRTARGRLPAVPSEIPAKGGRAVRGQADRAQHSGAVLAAKLASG